MESKSHTTMAPSHGPEPKPLRPTPASHARKATHQKIPPPIPKREIPPPRPGPGQPTKLTKLVHKRIIYAVGKLGMPEGRAGEYAGVSHSAPGIWRERGRKALNEWDTLTPEEQEHERPYAEFFESLIKAEVGFEVTNLKNIKNASSKDWRASDRLLQMKFPERYGKRMQLDQPEPIKHEHAHRVMTQEEAAIRSAEVLEKSRRLLGVIDAGETAARAAEEAIIEAIEGEDYEDVTE